MGSTRYGVFVYAHVFHLIVQMPAGDGVVSLLEDNYIKLVDLKTNAKHSLVAYQEIRNVHS